MTPRDDLARNRILGAMPATTRHLLEPLLLVEHLERGYILQAAEQEIANCYFPLDGVASLLVTEASGKSVDTSIIGNEGFVGLPVFLGTGSMPVEAMVQLDMTVATISANDLRQILAQLPDLANMLQRYTQIVLVELARLVLCNRVHPLEQRLARWLLQLNERTPHGTPMELTHDFLAEMIGSERPSVTHAVRHLSGLGYLAQNRRTITVEDRERLETAACDCYRTIRDERERLIRQPSRHDVTGGGGEEPATFSV